MDSWLGSNSLNSDTGFCITSLHSFCVQSWTQESIQDQEAVQLDQGGWCLPVRYQEASSPEGGMNIPPFFIPCHFINHKIVILVTLHFALCKFYWIKIYFWILIFSTVIQKLFDVTMKEMIRIEHFEVKKMIYFRILIYPRKSGTLFMKGHLKF